MYHNSHDGRCNASEVEQGVRTYTKHGNLKGLLFRRVRIFVKYAYYLRLVCPSARKSLGSRLKDYHEIWYWRLSVKSVQKLKMYAQSKTKTWGTLPADPSKVYCYRRHNIIIKASSKRAILSDRLHSQGGIKIMRTRHVTLCHTTLFYFSGSRLETAHARTHTRTVGLLQQQIGSGM